MPFAQAGPKEGGLEGPQAAADDAGIAVEGLDAAAAALERLTALLLFNSEGDSFAWSLKVISMISIHCAADTSSIEAANYDLQSCSVVDRTLCQHCCNAAAVAVRATSTALCQGKTAALANSWKDSKHGALPPVSHADADQELHFCTVCFPAPPREGGRRLEVVQEYVIDSWPCTT